jgi:hypothetical protein
MKKITILALAAALLAGCVEDTGNYTYLAPDEVSPVILSTLEENYDAISLEKLVIDPEIRDGGDAYEYAWYIYPVNNTGRPFDTLGYERKLDYTVTAQSGTYYLVFKVTDTERGTSVYQQTTLNISSIFGKGFYVNKYENGRTDVDFIDRYGVVNHNLLKQLNGDDLPGKPIRSAYVVNQYSYEVEDAAGEITRETLKPAYILCTDEDMRIYHGDNMQLLKTWDEAFLELPAVKKPQGVWGSSGGFMLLNNNSLQFCHTNGYSVGKFGYPHPSGDYKYATQVGPSSSGYCVFDETAGTFLGYYYTFITPLTNPYDYGTRHNYFDYDLIWLRTQPFYATSSPNTFALIKSRVDNSALVVNMWAGYIQNNMFVFESEYPLAPGLDLLDGKVFTCHGGGTSGSTVAGHSVIYYSTGDNNVHYYNISNQTTKTSVVTLPPDEEIVYLEHAYDYYYGVSLFIVLADKGGNWVLHVYDMEGATPDIKLPAVETYTGNGTPVNLIYRHPETRLTF